MKATISAIGIPSKRLQSSTSATHSCFRGRSSCVVLALFLLSCSSIRNARREVPTGGASAVPPRYSIVCIIHGDSDYLYHDSRGKAYRADEVTLDRAIMVGEKNPEAEVFIFYEKRRRHALLFFPLRDGEFYYYRNGQLLAEETYKRDTGQSRFTPEVQLYNCFHVEKQPQTARFFLYFGHEIPEFDGAGYDDSFSKRSFTVKDLANTLERITADSEKFDLIVLSACFNGTPHTIAALTPYSRYIIASPGNLHLSYFDLNPFERLDVGLRDGDVSAFAVRIAQQTFNRLQSEVQTEVTVAVYDADRVQKYLDSVKGIYGHALASFKEETPASVEHCDCAEDPEYVRPGMSEGVDLFYRPPLFGRYKHKQSHSGWECWRLVR